MLVLGSYLVKEKQTRVVVFTTTGLLTDVKIFTLHGPNSFLTPAATAKLRQKKVGIYQQSLKQMKEFFMKLEKTVFVEKSICFIHSFFLFIYFLV